MVMCDYICDAGRDVCNASYVVGLCDEVTARCGADARDYLVVQRLILVAVAIAAVPGLCVLLPIAIHLGSDGKFGQNEFAHTTVHHIPNQSPYLWQGPGTPACLLIVYQCSPRHPLQIVPVHHILNQSPYLWVACRYCPHVIRRTCPTRHPMHLPATSHDPVQLRKRGFKMPVDIVVSNVRRAVTAGRLFSPPPWRCVRWKPLRTRCSRRWCACGTLVRS